MRYVKISDLLDDFADPGVPPEAREAVSTENIKEIAMKKIKTETQTQTRRTRIKRPAMAVLAAVLALGLGAAAYAAVDWNGFALTGEMSRAGVEQVLYEASHGRVGSIVTEPDGTTRFYDAQGNETMALSWEEWVRYNQERIETRERAVRESTDLIDLDTMWFVPASVTELPVDAEGRFPDFALGNGNMVVLYPEGERGFALDAGARVTVTLALNDDSIVEFVVFRDGAVVASEHEREVEHEFTYEASEPGNYCFGLIYASASASNFTDCRLSID